MPPAYQISLKTHVVLNKIEGAMKKNAFRILSILLVIFVTGCTSNFPKVKSFYITPAKWGETSISTLNPDGSFVVYPPNMFALSPDGKYATYPNTDFIDLATGEESDPLANYKKMNFEDDGVVKLDAVKAWSSDGRYFAVYKSSFTEAPDGNKYPVYIYDNKEQTVIKLPDSVHGFFMWSPFNANHMMAYFHDDIQEEFGIFDVQGSLFSLLNEEIDFRNEKELRGNNNYLWGGKLDRPIAFIQTVVNKEFTPSEPIVPSFLTPSVEHPGVVIGSIYIDSYSYRMDYENPQYRLPVLENIPLNGNVDLIFDPSGRYILLVQWQCADSNFVHCAGYPVADVSNVTDTILTVLDWRTGEKQEMFRLSEIGDGYVAGSAPVAWSADGSTIVVGRYNASAVVLKLK
jgi:hypothetical protein